MHNTCTSSRESGQHVATPFVVYAVVGRERLAVGLAGERLWRELRRRDYLTVALFAPREAHGPIAADAPIDQDVDSVTFEKMQFPKVDVNMHGSEKIIRSHLFWLFEQGWLVAGKNI